MTTQDIAFVVIAISAAVVAVSLVATVFIVRGLSADTRALARRSEQLVAMLERELPPTIEAVNELSASVEKLSNDVQPRLKRLDKLADEAEKTLVAVRGLSAAVNDIVRGPASTVSGVKKSARVVGEGLASGADRLRRAIVDSGRGEDDQTG